MGSFAVLIPLWEDAGAVEELMHGVRLSAGQGRAGCSPCRVLSQTDVGVASSSSVWQGLWLLCSFTVMVFFSLSLY